MVLVLEPGAERRVRALRASTGCRPGFQRLCAEAAAVRQWGRVVPKQPQEPEREQEQEELRPEEEPGRRKAKGEANSEGEPNSQPISHHEPHASATHTPDPKLFLSGQRPRWTSRPGTCRTCPQRASIAAVVAVAAAVGAATGGSQGEPTQGPEEETGTEHAQELDALGAAAKRKAKMGRYADQPQGPKKKKRKGEKPRSHHARKRATPGE